MYCKGWMLAAAMLPLGVWAQDDKAVQLEEVNVKAARVTQKADGRLLVPTEAQKAASTNGYSLLAKLDLATLRIDEVMHTVTTLGNQGAVQLRIDGTLASKTDLLSLDPQRVRHINVIDNPGVRYGEGIAYVIDIKTTRADKGYTMGLDLSDALTTRRGDNAVYARMNRGKAEVGLAYDFNYTDFRNNDFREEADYLLTDGTHDVLTREVLQSRRRNYSHTVDLKCNLADSASYVFQATLSAAFDHNPGGWYDMLVSERGTGTLTSSRNRDRSSAPSLDLYFSHELGSHQTLTANTVATAIATRSHSYADEGGAYAYDVDGNTWSLMTEAIYENRLKRLNLSTGLRHSLKYTRNSYEGDVLSVNRMHNASLYLFGEAKGHWGPLGFVAGTGVSRERYRQGSYRYHYWLWRPKATLTWTIAEPWSLRYSFEVSQHISRIAMISDTRIRQNSREWTVGNPDLEPNRVTTHRLRLAYTRPRLTLGADAECRLNHNPNMASYSRSADNQFYYTQKNQPAINMYYAMGTMRYDLIDQKLTVSAYAGIYRFCNRGDDYRHDLTTYNYGGSAQAMLGRWTLTAYADNGWEFIEGEMHGNQSMATYLTCSYRMGNLELKLHWQHPLQDNPEIDRSEVLNRYVRKTMVIRSNNLGNMVTIGLAWKLNRGRRYRDIEKKMQNKDTQTGIL